MTKKDLLAKYKPYPTYTQIAIEGFQVGLNQGREEVKTDKIRSMEIRLKYLEEYHDNMEKTLHDPERLAELIGGL